jgi:reactive intermediate/imine deaminase
MKIIETPNMPKSNGHYSQCIEHNGILYLAGQLPRIPETRAIPEGIEAQTHQVLSNIERILAEAGSGKDKVLQVRVYVSDIKHWDTVNTIYANFFGQYKPARAVIPTRDLHHGALIEVEVTAFI